MNKKIIAFAFMGIALVSCGGNNDVTSNSSNYVESENVSFESVESSQHNHNFEISYNDEYHFEKCECGATQNEETHNCSMVEENGYNIPTCSCGYTGTPVEIGNIVSVYFSAPNSEYWGDKAYCYLWNSQKENSEELSWPGNEMTFVEVNGYGQNIYTYDIDLNAYDMVIFNNGNGWQSADTPLEGVSNNSGFYLNDDGSVGTYTYGA